MARSHRLPNLKHWFLSPEHPGQRVARVASGIVILIACLVLLGWVLKFPPLKTLLILGSGYMRANAALGLLLSGISLSLLTRKRRGRIPRIVQGCSIVTGAIGLLTLLQYVSGWNFGIDQLLFRDPVPNPPTLPPGRMGIPAAISLSLISAALWLLSTPEERNYSPNRTQLNRSSIAQLLAVIVGVIALQALLTRTFGLPSASWSGSAKTTMGGHTAFAFGVLSTGALALRSDRGWMQILSGESIGSLVARRFIPVVIVTPLILGWLILQGHQANWYDANFAMSLMSIVFAVTTVALIVRGSDRLNQVESDRKRSSDRLRSSEVRLQLAQVATHTGTWEWNPRTSEVFWSESCYRLFGVSLTEPEPFPVFLSRIHAEDLPKFEILAQQCIGITNPVEIEYRYHHPDLGLRWIFDRASADPNNPALIYGVSFDVTDRKQAELDRTQNQKTIQQQLAEIEAIYHTAPIGLGILDRDLRFVRINQRLAEINGLSIEAHLGRTVREIVPDLADEVEPLFRRVLDTGEPLLHLELNGETTAQPGVQRTWIENWYPLRDADEHIIGINVVVQEITQRKQMELTLRKSEDRFRTLADNIAQLAWIADASGSIGWYNQRWFDYTGTTLEEMQGWGWQKVHHPDHVDRVVERFRNCVETGEIWEDTFPLRSRNGQYRWFLSRAIPIRDQQGAILRWFGTNTDITDRKHLEDTLAAQTEELSRTNRLKDEFLAALSHELRTPLNPILVWTQMMREKRLTPTKTEEALATIERNTRQQIALVNDLLDVSRVIQGKLNLKLQPVDLATIVHDAIATVQFTAQAKRIEIAVHDLPELPVMGDRDRLQQVFWNLLSNSIKFTPEAGRIDIEGSISINNTTRYAQIRVMDNGIGITPEFLPHVFDHFRQADGSTTRKYGGLGLGLSIVRHLVELHGGSATVESPGVGQGATFTIRLPLCVKVTTLRSVPPVIDSEPSQSVLPSPQSTALTGRHILLIDDDRSNLDLLQFLLQEYGAIVTALTSPQAALDLIANRPPDLIVSDIGTPQINGYELMRRARALPGANRIPAIALLPEGTALTAFARTEDPAAAIEARFQAYVAKPVDPLELLSTLTDLASR